MDSSLRGFASEIFTLKIGPEEKQLNVPRDILTQVPFFSTSLSSGNFAESHKKSFDLPEDDAQAVADVIYYVYAGRVPSLNLNIEAVHKYVRAYIVADKFKAEIVANELATQLICYHAEQPVAPATVQILLDADLHSKPLCDVLLKDLAWYMKRGDFAEQGSCKADLEGESDGEGSVLSDKLDWSELDGWSKSNLLSLIHVIRNLQVEMYKDGPASDALDNLCGLHTHESTKKCSVPSENDD